MTAEFIQSEPRLSWRFPRTFWIANVAELFERAAFYGMFITLVLYLTRNVGFTDPQAGDIAACFSSILYLLPMFMGAMADKIGFRLALMLAFALLSAGYFLLGALPTKAGAVFALAVIMVGGAIVKPVIAGTVAKCSDERHRARAFSIFYWVVNIGAFSGKTVAAPLRQHLGLEYINYYASAMAIVALLWVAAFYRNVDAPATGRTFKEAWTGLVKVLRHVRFMTLILIVAGFWAIQGQLYATMPKYMLRLLGEGAKPEWLANINPFVVILLVVPITHLVRKVKPENAIAVALFIIPFSALTISLSPLLESSAGRAISALGILVMHPLTLLVVLGIALQGLAECFLSPKFLEYASRQAPQGEVGLYMGYQNLTVFFAWAFGFALSGRLLDRYCPDPGTLGTMEQAQWQAAVETGSALPAAYAHAHYIWFVYAAIGAAAFASLLIFKFVTSRIDRRLSAEISQG